MPPGSAYNWLCVLNSTIEIISHAAQYKAAQVAPKAIGSCIRPRKRRRTGDFADAQENDVEGMPRDGPSAVKFERPQLGLQREHAAQSIANDLKSVQEKLESLPLSTTLRKRATNNDASPISLPFRADALDASVAPNVTSNSPTNPSDERAKLISELKSEREPTVEVDSQKAPEKSIQSIASDFKPVQENQDHPPLPDQGALDIKPLSSTRTPKISEVLDASLVIDVDVFPKNSLNESATSSTPAYPSPVARNLQSSKVPSSRIGRLFHYGGLAASLGYGAASEVLRRTGTGSQEDSSVMMTEANIKRLVSKLSQMRGAALKLGQFMSIQDTHILPPEIDKIFRRVQDSAHYMPDWQMEQVMQTSLGPSWAENFVSFDRIPFAAASIGQVHTAVLAAAVSPTGREERVAVKIQFPNIASSIESDLGYIKLLLTAGRLLPKGLFLDRTIHAMKSELADECDYVREASFLRLFRSAEYLGNDDRFKVPWVWDGSTSTVLVMERVDGVSVGEATAQHLSQRDRTDISARIIELCLKELFEFRTMQTDPNWTNFLWNAQTRQIELVDFGATRTYSKAFMDDWFSILQAAARGDHDECIAASLRIGYLTGEENEMMLDAHVSSMTLLATPFKAETPQPFSFGQGSQWAEITAQIRAQIPVMLQHRLTPPPKETYSLNRKLSGSFLLASRMGASVDTKAIWDKVVSRYKLGDV